ncbi:gamma-glutamyltransferase family protein [Streptomyces zingiberis]|uniref:Gamma-glutamyltransferase family protein n=1 Tax=Streptomyces zingiberis TaxID=2053010 RepID=A0ABX1BYP5_9ACTN|nr:gamma-glutamyltransferase family protein [Streptomyces zingiberis]NJQ02822.1 gamma-glutamyltransferase family protein [Streptomyces zingiberis]
MTRPAVRSLSLLTAVAAVLSLTAAAPPAAPRHPGAVPAAAGTAGPGTAPPVGAPPPKTPVAVGRGGAVSSVDADASAAGLEILRRGGNAVDAAVATAAALGVTEPYSAGVGGGGYFVHYDAKHRTVRTIDGRETAPRTADERLFLGEDGKPIPFDEAVTSGLSVGTPGTPATWDAALSAWGSKSLREVLRPAQRIARQGFTVDETFRQQTADNADRFRDFPASAELFLPGGEPPAVGSTLRNPDLARTYELLARGGGRALYQGELARDIVGTVRRPPVRAGAGRTPRPGDLTTADLRDYRTKRQASVATSYRGLDVHGMAPSSSGGTTVAEALNILESTGPRRTAGEHRTGAADGPRSAGGTARDGGAGHLHRLIEASRLAFADRGRWVGDPAFNDVPARELVSQRFADSRACLIREDAALTSPVAPGDPRNPAACGTSGAPAPTPYEGESTTHLTTADRWGNVVAYTLTIEQTGGSGITVPGRGFLLNNELTDFSFTPAAAGVPDPNLPGPGKRPRSSMSPTIVLDEQRRPVVALGSPGGSTIITTVLQTLTNHLDRGMPLADAIAAPRVSQRNTETTQMEPGLWDDPARQRLEALGHRFTRTPEIGAVTGVQRLPGGKWLAAAETERRGGGSAMALDGGAPGHGHGR